MIDGAESPYDGVDGESLARRLGVPRVATFATVDSTMDVAHALGAAGAEAGTIVLADAQTGGRGRLGRRWTAPPGTGIWLTLIERPRDPATLGVLSLRLGLYAAAALEQYAESSIRLKWPNDLYVGERKLAGVLVEARWRDGHPEWVAIGFGVNVRQPDDVPTAAGLRATVSRITVLSALVPALRAAAACAGVLDAGELTQFAARDLARGRRIAEPGRGFVYGVSPSGELLVGDDDGNVTAVRQGSIVFERDSTR